MAQAIESKSLGSVQHSSCSRVTIVFSLSIGYCSFPSKFFFFHFFNFGQILNFYNQFIMQVAATVFKVTFLRYMHKHSALGLGHLLKKIPSHPKKNKVIL